MGVETWASGAKSVAHISGDFNFLQRPWDNKLKFITIIMRDKNPKNGWLTAVKGEREITRHILDVSANPPSNAKQMSLQMCLFYQGNRDTPCTVLHLSEEIMINEFYMILFW